MTAEIVQGLFAFFLGMLSSLFYFGGLWFTFSRLNDNKSLWLYFFSFLFRMVVIALLVFFFLPKTLLGWGTFLFAFTVMRKKIVNYIKTKEV